MILLDGKKTAQEIKDQLKNQVDQLKKDGEKKPHLVAILVGNDGGSITYVNAKVKACEYIGINSTLIKFDDDIPESELLKKVEELNRNDAIDGFIVQLPLPKHIDEQIILQQIGVGQCIKFRICFGVIKFQTNILMKQKFW